MHCIMHYMVHCSDGSYSNHRAVVHVFVGSFYKKMEAIEEIGRCIHGVVVFNGLLCSQVYSVKIRPHKNMVA